MGLLLLAAVMPLGAQSRTPEVTLRIGVVDTPDSFASACGAVGPVFGAEVRSRGRVFPFASLDRYMRSGGGDVGCSLGPSPGGPPSGGLSLDGTTSAMVGVGWRTKSASVRFWSVADRRSVLNATGFVAGARFAAVEARPGVPVRLEAFRAG